MVSLPTVRRRTPNKLPKMLAGSALAGAIAGAAGAMAAAEYVFRSMTRPSGRRPALRLGFTPFETGVDWEDVRFSTEGGVPLYGWLLTQAPDAPAILACGGYRGRRADLLGISSSLWRAGFTVLLFDYRGHGDEDGETPVTLGFRELADARAAWRYLRERRPNAPTGVIGFSMGAAIAIMLAAREPEVRAVWADSPFTSQRDILRSRMAARLGLGPGPHTEPLARLVLRLLDERLRRRLGFRLDDVHPLRDVAGVAPRALYLVHGEADAVVPADHGRQLAAAARAAGVPLETWFLPDVSHCGAYFLDRDEYCRRAISFFRTHVRSTMCVSTMCVGAGSTAVAD
jgi:dipeptidyl aminopeptidase/acylaminoacyl peptidase